MHDHAKPTQDNSRQDSAPRLPGRPRVAARPVEFDDPGTGPGSKDQFLAGAFGLIFTIVGWLDPHPGIASPSLILAYLCAGWFSAGKARAHLRAGLIEVHSLTLLVAAGAALIGDAKEGALLLAFFSFSSGVESLAGERIQRTLDPLFRPSRQAVLVLNEAGEERTEPVDSLCVGQRLRIKAGEQFPVDAELAKGETTADESMLTGEAAPVNKSVGDPLLAGTQNLSGTVEAIVRRTAATSAWSRIRRIVRTAQQTQTPGQHFIDRVGRQCLLGLVALSTGMFFVWWLALGHPPLFSTSDRSSAFYLSLILLVVASPCALVFSIPSAMVAAITACARKGALFRSAAAIDQLSEVKAVIIDKTGSLTTGQLRVESVESFPAGQKDEVLRLAASIARSSDHRVSQAIYRHARKLGLDLTPVDDFSETPEAGIQARIGSRKVRLGNRAWVQETSRGFVTAVPSPERVGITEVWLSAGETTGRLLLRDDLRLETRPLVQQLRARGLKTLVLTNDRPHSTESLRHELGIDEVRGELPPGEKLTIVETLEKNHEFTAVIGDPKADASRLAAAHVGVARWARLGDLGGEPAAVTLLNDRLENFVAAYQSSRFTRRVIHENLSLAYGVMAALTLLALAAKIPLALAAVGHEGVTIAVLLNSLRLLPRHTSGAAPR